MKKKGVEVYFAIYLATIISFFAIEGEVIEYKKNQALILLDMARDKIKDLVVLEKSNTVVENDTLFLSLKLSGQYEQDDFQGKATFSLTDDSTGEFNRELEYPLFREESTEQWYYLKAPLAHFGDFREREFNLTCALQVTPKLTPTLRQEWLSKFNQDAKIVNSLFENIEKIAPLKLERQLPSPIIPLGSGGGSEFTLNFPDQQYTVMKGFRWTFPLFVGGVRKNTDFRLRFVSGQNLCSFKKDTPETILNGVGKANGSIYLRGTRTSDNQTAEVQLKLRVIPPQWKNKTILQTIYTGETLTLNGEVRGVQLHETSLRLTGSLIKGGKQIVTPEASVGPFSHVGKITYQAMVNGVPIEKLKVTIQVQEPPPPKIFEPPQREFNTLIFRVTCFGKANRLDFIEKLANIGSVEETLLQQHPNRIEYKIKIEIQKPQQRSGDDHVFVRFRVYDTNGRKTEFSRKVVYNI